MAGEPEGRGPKATCLATKEYARLPSKPPVLSGGGASSEACGGAEATALKKGGWPTACEELLPPAWQPATQMARKLKKRAVRKESMDDESISAPPQEHRCGVPSAARPLRRPQCPGNRDQSSEP